MDLNSEKFRWAILIIVGVLFAVLIYGRIADDVADAELQTPSVPVKIHTPAVEPVAGGLVTPKLGIANPASTNCINVGGTLRIEKMPSGAEFGVCYFDDNRQCEEWAMMRGECPIGGKKVTGYISPAARFCAISGGAYTITKNGDENTEQGTCVLPGKKGTCDAREYFNGTCPKI